MAARTSWHAEASLAPTTRTTLGGIVDDVVVGGGVVGLSAAVELARQGRRVVLVEAHPTLGSGTSGRSTGKLSLLQGTRLATIESHHGPATSARYVEACRDAQGWVEQLLDRWDVDVQHRPAVTWASDGDRTADTRAEDAAARRAGLPTRWQREVPAGLPGYGAVVLDDQPQVDALAYVAALGAEAVAAGVDVRLGRRVRQVGGGAHPCVTLEDGEELRAAHVLVATGIPVLDRTAAFATVKPHRSYVVAFETGQEVLPMAVSVGSPSWTVRGVPRPGRAPLALVGGHGHVVGRSGPAGRHLEAVRRWAREHLDVGAEVAAWSAQDYLTPDEVPIAGRAPGRAPVHVVTGLGGWGLLAGVAGARAVATAVAHGRRLPLVPPGRLTGPRSMTSLAQWSAAVGGHLASGWLGALARPGDVPGESQGVVTRGRPPVATSTVDGCVRSVSGVCPHLGGVVRWNDVERTWDCPLHGSRFEPDGTLLEGPATRGLGPASAPRPAR